MTKRSVGPMTWTMRPRRIGLDTGISTVPWNASRRLWFGTVWINDHLPMASEMPRWRLQAIRIRQRHVHVRAGSIYTVVKHVMARLSK